MSTRASQFAISVALMMSLATSSALATGAEVRDPEPTAGQAVALINEAESTRTHAAELGAEWLNTANLIDQARQALAAGDAGQAARLASAALRQGELAVEQAVRESEAWRHRVPR